MTSSHHKDHGDLAPAAARVATSRGRRHEESPPRFRNEFQRDRDRIVHSTAFRRLEYKTQVFVNHVGDLYRTRLTHSLEVAQIGRTVARALSLNEDLTEAICLAHDLGHTPFGHAGQHALNDCMRDYGGFEHNLQSLRVVDELEEKYASFSGLNLMFETREGILKHCSRKNARELADVGQRFIDGKQPSLEAQIANLADEIAYNNHDVDDGLRSGLLSEKTLIQTRLFGEHYERTRRDIAPSGGRVLIYETIRRMIGEVVDDLIENSAANLAGAAPANIEQVRNAPRALISMSAAVGDKHRELKKHLRQHLYRHPSVCAMTDQADRVVRDLFAAFIASPGSMPDHYARLASTTDKMQTARLVADYIAGMTDRYAGAELARLMQHPAGAPNL